jgi:hypothetical protein
LIPAFAAAAARSTIMASSPKDPAELMIGVPGVPRGGGVHEYRMVTLQGAACANGCTPGANAIEAAAAKVNTTMVRLSAHA